MSNVRTKLIAAGVRNLRSFGYPACDEKNILTDLIYKEFFSSMLRDNKGQDEAADEIIDALLAKISKAEKPA